MSSNPVNRRKFITTLGLAGAGAVAAIATAGSLQPAAAPAAAAAPDSRGYRVSAHIRKYYQTTRV